MADLYQGLWFICKPKTFIQSIRLEEIYIKCRNLILIGEMVCVSVCVNRVLAIIRVSFLFYFPFVLAIFRHVRNRQRT